jgi:uncharacterized repeat protein (TIGR02543 family)
LVFSSLFFSVLVFTGCPSLIDDPTDDNPGNESKPEPEVKYTVTFNSYGGSPVDPIEITKGDVINPLPTPVRGGYIFQGWFTDRKTFFQEPFTSATPVTKNITIYAKWAENTNYTNGVLPDGTLNEKPRVIADRADENIIYTILISEDTECAYWDIVTRGINVVIEIRSADPQNPKKLSSSGTAALFGINNNLRGGEIHHNEAWDDAAKTGACGGGVFVYRATFIMNGGEIYSNTAYRGGGVYISGFKWSWDYNDLFEKKPLPGTEKSGVIWGYPANGKENYANGPVVYYAWDEGYYHVWRESTLGEYDAISTAGWMDENVNLDLESGWEYVE